MFLDLVDSNLTWAPPSATEIPLMQLVYSGYTLFFGSPCDYRQSDRFFRYAQGQGLIDGRQNGWMDLKLFAPEYTAKVNFLKACVRLRAAQGKYLTYGRMLEPVYPLDAVPTFEEGIFGWKHNERGSVPLAEARLWQAENGSLAVFFANYGDQRVPFRYRIDPASFGAKGSVINKTEMLEPASVRMVELGR
jgi:hypothetical protein